MSVAIIAMTDNSRTITGIEVSLVYVQYEITTTKNSGGGTWEEIVLPRLRRSSSFERVQVTKVISSDV
jgi:hypothetical protein